MEPGFVTVSKTEQRTMRLALYHAGMGLPLTVDDDERVTLLKCAHCSVATDVEEQVPAVGAIFRWFHCRRCGRVWYVPPR